MNMRLAVCSLMSLAFCGAALAQSGERQAARTPAASARCQALTGAERDRCLKRKNTKSGRKPDDRSGAGSSAPGGRADGEPGSYGTKAPPKAAD